MTGDPGFKVQEFRTQESPTCSVGAAFPATGTLDPAGHPGGYAYSFQGGTLPPCPSWLSCSVSVHRCTEHPRDVKNFSFLSYLSSESSLLPTVKTESKFLRPSDLTLWLPSLSPVIAVPASSPEVFTVVPPSGGCTELVWTKIA